MSTAPPTTIAPTTLPPYVEEIELDSIITLEITGHGEVSW